MLRTHALQLACCNLRGTVGDITGDLYMHSPNQVVRIKAIRVEFSFFTACVPRVNPQRCANSIYMAAPNPLNVGRPPGQFNCPASGRRHLESRQTGAVWAFAHRLTSETDLRGDWEMSSMIW